MAIHKIKFDVKNKNEDGKYADGGGLYLYIRGSAKSWVFRYRMPGRKERNMGLGSFPDIKLKEARDEAHRCRELLRKGIDPIEDRDSNFLKQKLAEARNMTFGACATAFIDWKSQAVNGGVPDWEPSTTKQMKRFVRLYLERVPKGAPKDAMPLTDLPVNVVDVPEIKSVLEPLYLTKTSTGEKVRSLIKGILDYATANKFRTGPNPAVNDDSFKMVLPNIKHREIKHHKSLPYAKIGNFMSALRQFRELDITGTRVLEICMNGLILEFIILTAVRTQEATKARWEEFEGWEESGPAIWTVPKPRTKSKKKKNAGPHVVPLSRRAVEILKIMKAKQVAEHIESDYVFVYGADEALRVGHRRFGQPITGEGEVIRFLQDTFGHPELTVHGFRSTFKSWQIDHFPTCEIAGEMALHHKVGSDVRNVYARDAQMLDQRQMLMQAWADRCDRIIEPDQVKVIPIRVVAS